MNISLRIFGMGLLVLPLAGCGPSGASSTVDPAEQAALQQVGEMLRDYQLTNGSPPGSLKQLQSNAGASLGGVEAIRANGIVVVWGAVLPDTREQPGGSPDDDVLAHGKDVAEKGGAVLLLNRTIRVMTADEFKAAPIAQSTVKAESSSKSGRKH